LSSPTEDYPYYTCELVCETAGSEPNHRLGDLTPITFVANISHAKLISTIIYGEDEEETEAYRYRVQTQMRNQAIDGNVYQYNKWLDEYDGIGKYRVVPCWNGKNTVKLLILDTESQSPSDELVNQVQNYFDPSTEVINDDVSNASYPQGRGMGNGKAPIGAIVTVDKPVELDVIVKAYVTLKDGYTSTAGVLEAVDNYFKSIAFNGTRISYFELANVILKVGCVADIIHLEVWSNDGIMFPGMGYDDTSIVIKDNKIPKLNPDSSVTVGA
jgi:uncharacterized phage protein gp47/JayE